MSATIAKCCLPSKDYLANEVDQNKCMRAIKRGWDGHLTANRIQMIGKEQHNYEIY